MAISAVLSSAQLAVVVLIVGCAAAAAGCGLESETIVTITCDAKCRRVYADGVRVEPDSNPRRMANWEKTNTITIPAGTQVLAVEANPGEEQSGILVSMDDGEVSDGSWVASTTDENSWADVNYCAEAWESATVVGQNGVEPWGAMPDFASNANWIWLNEERTPVYFRKVLGTACSAVTEACTSSPLNIAIAAPGTTTVAPTTTTVAPTTTTVASTTTPASVCGSLNAVVIDENLALEKPTEMISLYASKKYNWPSSLAVDGDNRTNLFRNSCSHTGEENQPWWTVDLGEVYHVTSVTITNRKDNFSERLNDFNIALTSLPPSGVSPSPNNYDVIYHQTDSMGAGETKAFASSDENISGQYVVIQLLGDATKLTLCEVEVHGFKCE